MLAGDNLSREDRQPSQSEMELPAKVWQIYDVKKDISDLKLDMQTLINNTTDIITRSQLDAAIQKSEKNIEQKIDTKNILSSRRDRNRLLGLMIVGLFTLIGNLALFIADRMVEM
jgi:hypothetical protein